MKICYWNIHKNISNEMLNLILELLNFKQLDLLFLSEFQGIDDVYWKKKMNENGYELLNDGVLCTKVLAIKKSECSFSAKNEQDRYIIIQDAKQNCLIASLHLEDRRNYDSISRKSTLEEIKRSISSFADSSTKVVYIGDFNCMPYEPELIHKKSLQCVLYRNLVNEKRMYNPMLLLLNEDNKNYGGYYYSSSDNPLYWYTFDQVIVNYLLADKIKTIENIKRINKWELLKHDKPNIIISDHLPLFIEIMEE